MIFKIDPFGNEQYEWARCTVCDFPIRTDRTPHGGRYTSSPTTTTINGSSVTVAPDGSKTGCPFCGTPWWDGGQAGDLKKPW